MKIRWLDTAVAAVLVLPLAACTSNAGGTDAPEGTVSVTSSDHACELSTDTAPAGNVVFRVTNDGQQATEFYLYAEDGLRIVGEVENIGPGLERNLVLNASAGRYVAACKPGMTGKGIRHPFTVTGSGDASAAVSGVDRRAVLGATRQPQYIPMQNRLATQDTLAEYLQPTGSGLSAVPPGVRRGGFVGETLLG